MKNVSEAKKLSVIEIVCNGGVGGVITGSSHRLNIKNSSVAVDYGMFQGRKEERTERGVRRNFTPAGDMAHGLSDVLLTHLHIDHSGLLPKIYKAGFNPRILTTVTTAMFLEPMLQNSAEIQAREDVQNRLYDVDDVERTLRGIKVVDPYKEVAIGQKHGRITVEFLPNGHVMGAASVLIRSREEGGHKNILFTGDMGKPNQSLCGGYMEQVAQYPGDSIHTLVVESTNFLKEPISFEEKRANLLSEIKDTWRDGGNPVLPVLSFHRFPEILEMLRNSQYDLEPKGDFQIIIDAPLGMTLLRYLKKLSPDQLSRQYGDEANYYKTGKDSLGRFDLKGTTIIDSHEDSVDCDKRFAGYRGKVIIIASGGMGENGRIVNYLRGDFCRNPKNKVIFTCFQVDGTKGASLTHYESVPNGNGRGARVKRIEGFTSHISGPEETFGFLERFNLRNLETVIITHGKDVARTAMANEFRKRGYTARIILPKLNQTVEV